MPEKFKWLEIAEKEIGTREIAGIQHNPAIVAYHSTTTLKATNDETPWCSAFVNWCMTQAGITGTRSAAARSWLDWGKVTEPVQGCVVILKRGTNPQSGHVGFYIGTAGGYVKVLGGNQSDSVKYSNLPIADVLGYRLPK